MDNSTRKIVARSDAPAVVPATRFDVALRDAARGLAAVMRTHGYAPKDGFQDFAQMIERGLALSFHRLDAGAAPQAARQVADALASLVSPAPVPGQVAAPGPAAAAHADPGAALPEHRSQPRLARQIVADLLRRKRHVQQEIRHLGADTKLKPQVRELLIDRASDRLTEVHNAAEVARRRLYGHPDYADPIEQAAQASREPTPRGG